MGCSKLRQHCLQWIFNKDCLQNVTSTDLSAASGFILNDSELLHLSTALLLGQWIWKVDMNCHCMNTADLFAHFLQAAGHAGQFRNLGFPLKQKGLNTWSFSRSAKGQTLPLAILLPAKRLFGHPVSDKILWNKLKCFEANCSWAQNELDAKYHY